MICKIANVVSTTTNILRPERFKHKHFDHDSMIEINIKMMNY